MTYGACSAPKPNHLNTRDSLPDALNTDLSSLIADTDTMPRASQATPSQPTLSQPFRLTLEMQHLCQTIAGLLPDEPQEDQNSEKFSTVPVSGDVLSHMSHLRRCLVKNRVQVSWLVSNAVIPNTFVT